MIYVISLGYFHTQRGKLKRLIAIVASEALNRKDPDLMQDDIDMANHSIVNLKDPQPHDSFNAATVNFVNQAINDNNATIDALINSEMEESDDLNIKAAKQENAFVFVMDNDHFKQDDDDITEVGKVNKDFYNINHKNYNFLACDWFKNVLFSTNSLVKLLSDSLLLDSLLSVDSLLSDSLISQSHSKM